ncbi:DUF3536 domain-containing protein [Pontibacter qinzhouensis]|uniref:DUF3536 domain-containing protein n=1 Tax=Pontibacter qinzhouensis TaxID=2603253 RepID=A0A5C8IKQ1_9BACT|nr:DUF3536 domain-containing protein [Pontibacter qinzhouensis]TXK21566.1 DUF3536 domain-containing protein [Pontibacter qinzhouensis]
MKDKYICIHGHFYQPPRENPWLNEVEIQESASPFHDWNERISNECYARNSASRILGEGGAIVDIMNNYSRISFNFGPTLLEWMQKKDPETYQAILDADKESCERFSGHGSALAQVYNHMIMPLANSRDKHTQVIWGKHDFKQRFGRDPEGMWLGETAANTETLEVLAEHGIKFTILSPYQANKFRKIGDKEWHDGVGAKIDPRRAYRCNLPSGRSIALFFYDGPVSQGIAFEGLLNSGERFAHRLGSTLDQQAKEPQLMHIATDGETYGHHHRFGEMALSYAIRFIEEQHHATLTVYGEFLEKHPPEYEAKITEDTSWSCAHGVERWRSNCGCNTGGNGNWNQEWRGPLRDAFDWLRDQLAPLYEKEMKKLTADPWITRNDYIEVIMDRSEENVKQFIASHTSRNLNKEEESRFLSLLDMQYHTMLMYTSCGWFFDEVTGIETVQDIYYAARALQLAYGINSQDYRTGFLKLLAKAESNIPDYGNAAEVYNKHVKPTIINLLRVGAHYAVASLFSDKPENLNLYSYSATSENYDLLEAGRLKLATGQAKIHSNITWNEDVFTFAVLHMGDHQLFGGVRKFIDDSTFKVMHLELSNAFNRGNVSEVIMLLDKYFESHYYSFWHLFKDDQKKILDQVLEQTMHNIENDFLNVYNNNYPLMQAMRRLAMPLPRPLLTTVEYIVNNRLQQEIAKPEINPQEVQKLLNEAERMNVKLNAETLSFDMAKRVQDLMQQLGQYPDNVNLMDLLIDLINLFRKSPVEPEYWHAQNIAFMMRKEIYEDYKHWSDKGDEGAADWCRKFDQLYQSLNLKA